jgi:2Fe-2S ferredoxin
LPKIVFIDFTGVAREVIAPVGATVRDAAIKNNIPGIVSECGGVLACATCQVYVQNGWYEKLQSMSDSERGLLEFANDPRPDSRLSCQIKITPELDGLTVKTPQSQS